jgi:hypothetical protein
MRESLVRGILFSAVGPLLLASENLGEYWPGDIVILLFLTSFVALSVTVLRRSLLGYVGEVRGSALDLTVLGAMAWPFMIAYDLAPILPASRMLRIRSIVLLTVFVSAVFIFWILAKQGPSRRFLQAVTAAATFLSISSIARITIGEYQLRKFLVTSATARQLLRWDADSAVRSLNLKNRPDVFVLILDAYAGDSLLRSDYGVDHRELRDSLAAMGFERSQSYRSNYSRTFASVSSFLNFSQIAQVEAEPIGATQHAGFLTYLITNNRTTRIFQALGYDVHWMPAPFFGGRRLSPAGVTVHRPWRSAYFSSWNDSYLVSTWLKRTWTPGVVAASLGYGTNFADASDSILALMPRLVSRQRPVFAFGHLFATHEPYVYTDSCQVNPTAVAREANVRAYAASVRCLDVRLIAAFRQIIRATKGEAVIVAIGDHAPPRSANPDQDLHPDNATLASRFDAGAYFYLPPSLRPKFQVPEGAVRVIPAVLRAAFGAEIPVSPNDLYFSSSRPDPIYHFVRVQNWESGDTLGRPLTSERVPPRHLTTLGPEPSASLSPPALPTTPDSPPHPSPAPDQSKAATPSPPPPTAATPARHHHTAPAHTAQPSPAPTSPQHTAHLPLQQHAADPPARAASSIAFSHSPATPHTSRRHTPRRIIQRPINQRLTLLAIIERRPPDKQITHRRYQQPLRTQHLAQ